MSVKTDKSLSEIFDVTPINETLPIVPKDLPMVSKAEEDFELARLTIQGVMAKGLNSLENASLVANGTEDPESYNAVSNLMGKLITASEKLIDIHAKKVAQEPKVAINQTGETTTNINGPVFVGSTSELAKMISDSRKG